jgi:hypothetical protein
MKCGGCHGRPSWFSRGGVRRCWSGDPRTHWAEDAREVCGRSPDGQGRVPEIHRGVARNRLGDGSGAFQPSPDRPGAGGGRGGWFGTRWGRGTTELPRQDSNLRPVASTANPSPARISNLRLKQRGIFGRPRPRRARNDPRNRHRNRHRANSGRELACRGSAHEPGRAIAQNSPETHVVGDEGLGSFAGKAKADRLLRRAGPRLSYTGAVSKSSLSIHRRFLSA